MAGMQQQRGKGVAPVRRRRGSGSVVAAAATPLPPLLSLLHPYQRAWVLDDSRFKIGMWARQTGKSFATACEAVLGCVLRPGEQWVVLSAGERQALEWMAKARQWAEAAQVALSGYEETVEAGDATKTRAALLFANGSRIVAIPANPDTARGYSANLILDEFAIHEKPWEIWAAIFPSITSPHGGEKRLRIVSTPKGLGNKFADLWHKNEAYSRHKVTIQDAVAQGLEINLQQLREGVDDEDIWQQEYLCEFLDRGGVLLPYEMLAACTLPEGSGDVAGDDTAPLYVGMDVGRSHDISVILTLEERGGTLYLRHKLELRCTPFAEQLEALRAIVATPRVRVCCVDATGIGAMLAEEARRIVGGKVRPITFTHAVKEELFTGLRRRFEEKTIRILPDRELREDLHAVTKSVSAGGTVTFGAARSLDGHSDRASALALACYAASRCARYHPPILGTRSGSYDRRRI